MLELNSNDLIGQYFMPPLFIPTPFDRTMYALCIATVTHWPFTIQQHSRPRELIDSNIHPLPAYFTWPKYEVNHYLYLVLKEYLLHNQLLAHQQSVILRYAVLIIFEYSLCSVHQKAHAWSQDESLFCYSHITQLNWTEVPLTGVNHTYSVHSLSHSSLSQCSSKPSSSLIHNIAFVTYPKSSITDIDKNKIIDWVLETCITNNNSGSSLI